MERWSRSSQIAATTRHDQHGQRSGGRSNPGASSARSPAAPCRPAVGEQQRFRTARLQRMAPAPASPPAGALSQRREQNAPTSAPGDAAARTASWARARALARRPRVDRLRGLASHPPAATRAINAVTSVERRNAHESQIVGCARAGVRQATRRCKAIQGPPAVVFGGGQRAGASVKAEPEERPRRFATKATARDNALPAGVSAAVCTRPSTSPPHELPPPSAAPRCLRSSKAGC
jgi:hypothetical protein